MALSHASNQCFWVELAGEQAQKVHDYKASKDIIPKKTLESVPCFVLDSRTPVAATYGLCIEADITMECRRTVFSNTKCGRTGYPFEKYYYLCPKVDHPMRIRRFLPHGTIIRRHIIATPPRDQSYKVPINLFPLTSPGELPWEGTRYLESPNSSEELPFQTAIMDPGQTTSTQDKASSTMEAGILHPTQSTSSRPPPAAMNNFQPLAASTTQESRGTSPIIPSLEDLLAAGPSGQRSVDTPLQVEVEVVTGAKRSKSLSPNANTTTIKLRPRTPNRHSYIEKYTRRSSRKRTTTPTSAKRKLPITPPTPIKPRSPTGSPPRKRLNNNKDSQITYGPLTSTQADTQPPPTSMNVTQPLDSQPAPQTEADTSQDTSADKDTSNEAGTKTMQSSDSSNNSSLKILKEKIVKYYGAKGNPLPPTHAFDRSQTNVSTAAPTSSRPDHDGSLPEHVIIAINGDNPNIIDDIIYVNRRSDPEQLIQAYRRGLLNTSAHDEGIAIDPPPVLFGPPTPPRSSSSSSQPDSSRPSLTSSGSSNTSSQAVRGSSSSSMTSTSSSSTANPSTSSSMSISSNSSAQHDVSMASLMDTTAASSSDSQTLAEATQAPQRNVEDPQGKRGGERGGHEN